MYADLEKQCQQCGNKFWWLASEQQFYADRGFVPPKRCPDCRAKKKADQGRTATTDDPVNPSQRLTGHLVKTPATHPARVPTVIDKVAPFADIEQMVSEAT